MEDVDTVENFYGVYLLYCLNPKYKGRTYIGYTVDPNRRIRQHNKGKQYGGAWKTSNKGPWSMVMIIHGFPNDIAALRFEWAWQHPQVSRRLQHVQKKKTKEKSYDFCIRVLSEMLTVGPWCRLPLTIRWLNSEFVKEFSSLKVPPLHMPICQGPVISKKLQKTAEGSTDVPDQGHASYCNLCFKPIEGRKLNCLNGRCNLNSHVVCLSKHFVDKGEYIPVEGKCPKCAGTFLWGDIIRKFRGCYNSLDLSINVDSANAFYSSDSE
ncbi:structure-specific endonuclease subunit slx1 [Anoplophora glabripennis]|uniref:structure-specific endonuclease subunit slx1 n=1 Tax=Anoplophora glabripennis TaxID=217634 RepID=UPI00087501F6|nr:structure-specific endonuclease subunit slx1 [Anoplophora glabripennis]